LLEVLLQSIAGSDNIYWVSMQSAVIFICCCKLWPSGCNIHRMILLVRQIFIHRSAILLYGIPLL